MGSERKQTRRSLSISGELYQQLKDHCHLNSLSMSGITEALLREHLGMPQRTAAAKPPQEAPARVDKAVKSVDIVAALIPIPQPEPQEALDKAVISVHKRREHEEDELPAISDVPPTANRPAASAVELPPRDIGNVFTL